MNHRLMVRLILVLVIAVVTATAAQTEIKGNTNTSVFQNGSSTWKDLTFAPASFDILPGAFVNGSATISNLGQFTLGNDWNSYDGGSFSLKINFTAPTGFTQGDKTWEAVLTGDIWIWDTVKLSFTQWSDTFAYSNASGSGQFTLTLGGFDSNGTAQVQNGKLVYDLCQATLTGSITNASFNTVTTESTVPEPSAVVLLGTVLLGVVGLLRRKMA